MLYFTTWSKHGMAVIACVHDHWSLFSTLLGCVITRHTPASSAQCLSQQLTWVLTYICIKPSCRLIYLPRRITMPLHTCLCKSHSQSCGLTGSLFLRSASQHQHQHQADRWWITSPGFAQAKKKKPLQPADPRFGSVFSNIFGGGAVVTSVVGSSAKSESAATTRCVQIRSRATATWVSPFSIPVMRRCWHLK